MGVSVREKVKGSGIWWVFVKHKGQRTSSMIGSETAAEKVKEIVEAQLKLGQYVFPKKESAERDLPTVQEYFEKLNESYYQTAIRESTADKYRTNFKVHILPPIGHLRLDEVTRKHMEVLVSDLVARKQLAKATIETIVRGLSGLFSHATDHGVVQANPVSRLGKFYSQARVPREEDIDPLAPEEVSKFLQSAERHAPQHKTLFLCAIHSGLRVGELAGLEWGDVDWNSKFIKVQRSYDRVHRKIVPTKTKKIRRVDLSDELISGLRELERSRRADWLAKGKNEIPEVVFCNELGGRMDAANVSERHFHRCLKKAGVRRIRFHDLRHTFAGLLLSYGAPIAYVSEQLGHSSIEMTVKRYGKLLPGANRRFINILPGANGSSESAPQGHPGETATSPVSQAFSQIVGII
jgi:integrase